MKSYINETAEPRVGDIIRYDGRSYYPPSGLNKGENYEVLEVKKYAKSYGVKLLGSYGQSWSSATNYKLMEPSKLPDSSLNQDNTFMCIDGGRIVSSHPDEETAKSAAADIVASDIKKQIVVAEVITVAKVKKPEVVFK